MPADSSPDHVTSIDQLRTLYRQPHQTVLDKVIDHIDDGARDFIARSPFVTVGTSGPTGALDVSPRGGPVGFVKVLDDQRLAIPDLNGNNRLDTLTNVIETGEVALQFTIPGLGETLRMNGTAVVTTEDTVLDRFTDELRRPVSAIEVTVRETYLHCAKAYLRSGLWKPDTWPTKDQQPSPGTILAGHAGVDVPGDVIDADLAEGYELGLAYDKPES